MKKLFLPFLIFVFLSSCSNKKQLVYISGADKQNIYSINKEPYKIEGGYFKNRGVYIIS